MTEGMATSTHGALSRPLRGAISFAGGLAFSLIVVMTTGILTIQSIGVADGAIINLNNEVVAIANPRVPVLQFAAIAVLAVLAVYLVAFGTWRWEKSTRVCLTLGFVVGLAVSTAWALMSLSQNPAPGEYAIAPGWQGWIEQGGENSAVHIILLISIASIWLPRFTKTEVKQDASSQT